LAYQMTAERDNEKAESRNESVFIAVAKARVWASEGWQVVVTDDNGRTFAPEEFEDLCSLDAKFLEAKSLEAKCLDEKSLEAKSLEAKSLEAGKSWHAPMEDADEQHNDSETLDEQHDQSRQLDGAGEERIGHPLLADAGAGTVPADEADIVAERQQFFGNRRDKGSVTAAGDVAAADRTIEKYIANMSKPHRLVEEHDAAG
jgi:hypothetical protein